jgi:hypothetical protein
MIGVVNFGGTDHSESTAEPNVAPTPVEHQIKKQEIIKNREPKQIDE